jgi:hypothetical protein
VAPRRTVLLTVFLMEGNFLEGGVWWRLVEAEVSLMYTSSRKGGEFPERSSREC